MARQHQWHRRMVVEAHHAARVGTDGEAGSREGTLESCLDHIRTWFASGTGKVRAVGREIRPLEGLLGLLPKSVQQLAKYEVSDIPTVFLKIRAVGFKESDTVLALVSTLRSYFGYRMTSRAS